MLESPSGVSDDTLCRVLGNIKSDPDLRPIERNVAFVTDADSDVFRVDVEVPSLIRRLLLHPEFDIEEIRVSDGDRFGARMPVSEYREGDITGVKGELPVGCMKVSESPRSRASWSTLVASGVLDNDPRDGGSK
jgi:hypothetical protein